jgi:5'-deoxynucleotidase YfbR-like HD superfamily hydrolase
MSAREQLRPELHLVPPLEEARASEEAVLLPHFRAETVLQTMKDVITDIYWPFRGQAGYKTERAIFVAPPHVPHRENNAEHSWHNAITVQAIWDNREELGIVFPNGYSVAKAVQLAHAHDFMEIPSGDVDAMTRDMGLLAAKDAKEWAAYEAFKASHPRYRGIAELWAEAKRNESYEARWNHDIDKTVSTLNICLDGGKKWHNWEGYTTSREVMCARQRGKLTTQLGHLVFDALERDLDEHPEYFPAHGFDPQGTLFDLA